jgi:hypothetical protein
LKLEYHQGHVIQNFPRADVGFYIGDNRLLDGFNALIPMSLSDLAEAFDAVEFPLGVFRFGDAVGK